MQSQVGIRKNHYEQRMWRWWNYSWAIINPKRWCCESAALNITVNLKNSAVATDLEKFSFHSNLKERQCQRMFKLLHNCTHLTCYQSNAQNSPSQASIVHFSSVQSLSHFRMFATPWIAACHTSLAITISRSSLKLTCIESVMPSSQDRKSVV